MLSQSRFNMILEVIEYATTLRNGGYSAVIECTAEHCAVPQSNVSQWLREAKKIKDKHGKKEAAMVLGIKARKTFGVTGDRFRHNQTMPEKMLVKHIKEQIHKRLEKKRVVNIQFVKLLAKDCFLYQNRSFQIKI